MQPTPNPTNTTPPGSRPKTCGPPLTTHKTIALQKKKLKKNKTKLTNANEKY
jgi:hypothetical protein